MKRIFLIVYCMMAVLCSSHAQHFEFMGIPIDGSIEAFDAKLKAKGFVYVGDLDNKSLGDVSAKMYTGIFNEKKVLLNVLRTRTNLVFAINVVQYFKRLDDVKSQWEYYVSVIEDKYKDKIVAKLAHKESAACFKYKMELGDIGVWYRKEDTAPYEYELSLNYYDRKNTDIHKAIDKR